MFSLHHIRSALLQCTLYTVYKQLTTMTLTWVSGCTWKVCLTPNKKITSLYLHLRHSCLACVWVCKCKCVNEAYVWSWALTKCANMTFAHICLSTAICWGISSSGLWEHTVTWEIIEAHMPTPTECECVCVQATLTNRHNYLKMCLRSWVITYVDYIPGHVLCNNTHVHASL